MDEKTTAPQADHDDEHHLVIEISSDDDDGDDVQKVKVEKEGNAEEVEGHLSHILNLIQSSEV